MSMPPDEYLEKVLKRETFDNDAPELVELRKRRKEVRDLLLKYFADSNPSIRWAGSMAKDTMVKVSYDGDVTCYFANDEESESTLEDLYEETEKALQQDYLVERKPSALRISDKKLSSYLHVDVVPGRFTDGDEGDVFLHRTTGDKTRLKTNLSVHIEHVQKSGVREAIRLAKIWNCRHGVRAKTFILELLVIELLKAKKSSSLSEQMLHIWTEMRDHPEDLVVEDPANPSGNDLTEALDECRWNLSAIANATLATISASGWHPVFGDVEDDDDGGSSGKKSKAAAFSAAVAAVSRPTKPWSE